MASTLAGNFTLVGSVANLIVVQRARAQNVEIGLWEYFNLFPAVGSWQNRRIRANAMA
jgi:Na+/H+ antiporter NhaD/arsenite permease-like protein